MKHGTNIQWCHVPGYRGDTWNPTTGCTRVSPGCDHCYAFALHDQRYVAKRAGKAVSGKQYDLPFSRVQLLEERLTVPLRKRTPTAYFVDSMADLFHEDVPDVYLDRVFGVMAAAYWHVFMVLTKRPERMREYLTRRPRDNSERAAMYDNAAAAHFRVDCRKAEYEQVRVIDRQDEQGAAMGDPCDWPLRNVWLGVSAEDQQRFDERWAQLEETPAAVRFVSAEPLLGPIDMAMPHEIPGTGGSWSCARHFPVACECLFRRHTPDWIIVGGESGKGARPFHLDWARSLRDQCAAAGVPLFVKQLGARPHSPAPLRLRHSHGGDPEEWPSDLRIRQFPAVVGEAVAS